MRKILFSVAMALLVPSTLNAQSHHLEELIAPHLYPPDYIREMQSRLDLSEEQEVAIRELTLEFQKVSGELEWGMEDRIQALVPLIEGGRIEVEEALDVLDEVLEMEAQVKRNHFRLLIDLKNLLTPEQQDLMGRFMEELLRRGGPGEGHERDDLEVHEHRGEEVASPVMG
jgi:Spy/CpxP family protein refolding chaperone